MKDEKDQMAERYERRNTEEVQKRNSNLYFNHYAVAEKELIYAEILRKHFLNPESLRVLEIGAGSGGNLLFFKRMGVTWTNLYANELLPERLKVLKENYPNIKVFEGDASEINHEDHKFDIVFQSTVFTSILNFDFKKKVADKMWSLLKPGGIILWYDFMYDNPSNKDVKGIGKNEIRKLFSLSTEISFTKVTLAPPIGRRVKKLYPIFNIFPFLRTHIIAVVKKPKA